MNKKLLAAALGLSAITAQASPVTLTIDDFNSGAQVVKNLGVGTTSDTNSIRTITNVLHSSVNPVENTATVTAGPDGVFDVSNGGGETATVSVAWNIAGGLVPSSASNLAFSLLLIQSDLNPTNVTFNYGGVDIGSFSFTDVKNDTVRFALGGVDFSQGGLLTMSVDGSQGWDMTLDSLGLTFDNDTPTVPEPGSVALVGVALLGAALARRRRNK